MSSKREKAKSPQPDLPKSVLKAQKLAAKKMQDQAAAGYSPGTMRKAQVQGMGQHASLSVVEDAVRAVEGGVLSDLSQDAALRNRVIKLRSTSTEVVFEQERIEKRLDDIGSRLRVLREGLADQEHLSKVTRAEIQYSTLSAKAGVMLDDAEKEQLVTNLEESQKIVANLEGVGSRRNHILLHCLNGLANAKVATATGVEERKEVLSQLYTLLHEDQTLEIPHNNGQVRLNHCLKICERIVARAIDVDEVVKLEDTVFELEKLLPPSSPMSAGGDRGSAPPPEEED